jgi:hypothetical protein
MVDQLRFNTVKVILLMQCEQQENNALTRAKESSTTELTAAVNASAHSFVWRDDSLGIQARYVGFRKSEVQRQ